MYEILKFLVGHISHCHLLCAALSSNVGACSLSLSLRSSRVVQTILYINWPIFKNLLLYFHTYVFVCLFGIFVPLENFSLIWRRHLYRWRAANFDLCSALMAMEQWGLFSTYCDTGHPFIMAISDDARYSRLLPSVWHRSCHYLF